MEKDKKINQMNRQIQTIGKNVYKRANLAAIERLGYFSGHIN